MLRWPGRTSASSGRSAPKTDYPPIPRSRGVSPGTNDQNQAAPSDDFTPPKPDEPPQNRTFGRVNTAEPKKSVSFSRPIRIWRQMRKPIRD